MIIFWVRNPRLHEQSLRVGVWVTAKLFMLCVCMWGVGSQIYVFYFWMIYIDIYRIKEKRYFTCKLAISWKNDFQNMRSKINWGT